MEWNWRDNQGLLGGYNGCIISDSCTFMSEPEDLPLQCLRVSFCPEAAKGGFAGTSAMCGRLWALHNAQTTSGPSLCHWPLANTITSRGVHCVAPALSPKVYLKWIASAS